MKSWNLNYGMFEDNPDKVAAAARALRKRDSARNAGPREQPSQGVYDVLVRESRELLAAGKLDDAESKAKRAQRMNVVPSVTADRADDVLHDIAMTRSRKGDSKDDKAIAVAGATAVAGAAGIAVAVESASAKAEREADELVNKGDGKAAAAKFAEAEALCAEEAGQPVDAAAALAPAAVAAPALVSALPADGSAPASAPAPAAATAPTVDAPAPAPAPVDAGTQLLAEATALYKSGNFTAAKETAERARAAKADGAKVDDLVSQITVAEQGGALSLYESAMDAVRKNDVARAKSLLNEVAASDGADDSLRAKAQGMLDKLPKDDAGKAVATDKLAADDPDVIAAQKLNAEVGTKLAEARRLLDTDPDKAIGIYEQTLKGVEGSGLPASLTRPMVQRLKVQIELAKKDKVAFDLKMQDKAYRQEIENKRLRIFEADKAKKDRLKDFLDKAQDGMAQGKYVEAETYAKKAQEIDPNEVASFIIAFKAKAERRYKANIENRDLKENGVVEEFLSIDRATVIDPELQLRGINYATNFKDLTRERMRMNAALEPKRNPRDLAIESKLNEAITVNFDKQPLSEAITFLQNYTGLNIVLDPKALADENVTSATPIDLHLTNARLKNVLKLMLKPMGLTFKIEDEVLLITSPSMSLANTIPKTYYVGDLMMPASPQSHNAKALDGVSTPSTGSAGDPSISPAMAGMPGNGMAPPGAPATRAAGMVSKNGERPIYDMTPLIQIITSAIAPNTWRVYDDGGQEVSGAYGMGGGFGGGGADAGNDTQPIGSITPFYLSISLIIRHTAEIHDQVADLLRQLRRLQDLQVSIEVRFITVSDIFFEQIGTSFDFSIASKTVGPKSTFAVPNPSASLFSTTTTAGGTTSGGTTSGGTSGGGLGGGTTGGTSGGGLGGGGGASGNLGGGGGGIGGGGGGLGGGTGGATAGGTSGGGSSSGGTSISPYLVNPFRDYSVGSNPIVVGTQAAGIGHFTPNLQIPFNNTNPSLAIPSEAQPGAGATFGIAFLSDLEVYLFLTAAQGDTRSNILQAPKVTTFNGAPATIFNTEQIPYIAALTPVVELGAIAFAPSIASFPNGVTLSVTPVVSADRRYVRMTLSPVFTALEGFTNITTSLGAVGGGGVGGLGPR